MYTAMNWQCLLYCLVAILVSVFGVTAVPGVCKNMRYYELKRVPDYCKSPPHLGCDNENKNWSKECGKQPNLLEITPDIIRHFLSQHDIYRNIIANGSLSNFPVAGRMLKMKWDAYLAELAEFAVKRCTIEPITMNMSTYEAIKPGYNTVLTKYPLDEEQDVLKIISSQIKIWFDQHKFANLKSLKSGKSKNGEEISHFLQIIIGGNDRIGCAVSQFQKGEWKYQLLVCLYACYKIKNKPAYRIGKKPGDMCQCGLHKKHKNICDYLETIGDCTRQPDADDS